MRVFLDANVLFSAVKTDGAVSELVRLVVAAGHECFADEYVVEEAWRSLMRRWPDRVAMLDRLLASMTVAGVQPQIELGVDVRLPARDRPVPSAAIGLSCDVLVTGDRTRFGALYGRTIRGVAVHSPRSLADLILARRT